MKYGRYEIVSELGRGSMGVVYLAHDPSIDRQVALKVLREDRVTSDDFVQRFLKEARAVGRLSHPGIVTVYDIGQDHGTIYIAMEFLEGTPLDQMMAEQRFSVEDIIDLGVQVAEALDYAHGRGIVHRDIKPPNIMVAADGTVRVTDFGIAHIEDPDGYQMTQAGEILGTPIYMSPEQVAGQPVDGRSDIYSLGVILYELTTGRRPFEGSNLAALFRAITQDTPPPPEQVNSGIPRRLSEVIMRAMNRVPEKRYAGGRDLARDLRNCLATEPAATVAGGSRSGRGMTWIVVLVMLVVAGGVGGYLYLFPPGAGQKQQEQTLQKAAVPEVKPEAESAPSAPSRQVVPQETKSETGQREERPQSATRAAVSSQGTEKENRLPALQPQEVKKKPVPVEKKQVSETPAGAESGTRDLLLPPAEPEEDIFELQPQTTGKPVAGKPPVRSFPKEKSSPPAAKPATVKTVRPQTQTVKETVKPARRHAALLPEKTVPEKHAPVVQTLLKMNSRPAGADLYIDGALRGRTPVRLQLAGGKYEVRLKLAGHLDWKAQLDLSRGGEVPLTVRLLPAATGKGSGK